MPLDLRIKKEILDLKTQLITQQNFSWRSNIHIKGLSENVQREKELLKLILGWVNKVSSEMQQTLYDLEQVHRVSKKVRDQSPHLLVRFAATGKKRILWRYLMEKSGNLKIDSDDIEVFHDYIMKWWIKEKCELSQLF